MGYLLGQVDGREVRMAASRASLATILGAILLYYTALACGGFRFHWLLRALGASPVPPVTRLLRLYLIGLFYNTFVPGGIGGDVVRAVAVRHAFGSRGLAGALSVVLVERAMGLGGMCLLVASAAWLFPLPSLPGLSYLGAVGTAMSLGGFVALGMARRLASYMPSPLRALAERLPQLQRLSPMPAAVLSAVATHFFAACAGHLFVLMVAPHVTLGQSLVVVPLSLSAAYLPISVGGVGVVEVALVELLQLLGVAPAESLVAAVAMRLCQWLVALPGGLLVLVGERPPALSPHA